MCQRSATQECSEKPQLAEMFWLVHPSRSVEPGNPAVVTPPYFLRQGQPPSSSCVGDKERGVCGSMFPDACSIMQAMILLHVCLQLLAYFPTGKGGCNVIQLTREGLPKVIVPCAVPKHLLIAHGQCLGEFWVRMNLCLLVYVIVRCHVRLPRLSQPLFPRENILRPFVKTNDPLIACTGALESGTHVASFNKTFQFSSVQFNSKKPQPQSLRGTLLSQALYRRDTVGCYARICTGTALKYMCVKASLVCRIAVSPLCSRARGWDAAVERFGGRKLTSHP